MKKRIFAIALALSMSLGTVSAYAQTQTSTQPMQLSEYEILLGSSYVLNYAYPIRSHSDELTIIVSHAPAYYDYNLMRSSMPTHISLVNMKIADLEKLNQTITNGKVEAFYAIQPQLNKIIAAGKLYVDGCNKVYNGNAQGFSMVNSASSSIHDAQLEIAAYCDNLYGTVKYGLDTLFPSNWFRRGNNLKKYFFLIFAFSSIFLSSCSSDNSAYSNGYDDGYKDGYEAGQEDTIVNAVSREDFYPADTIGYWEGQYEAITDILDLYDLPQSMKNELLENLNDIENELRELEPES